MRRCFNLIGTTYGGDGESTFALPNLQSRIPIHMGNGANGINYQLAEMAGAEQVTLTAQQIPIHNHTLLASTAIGTVNTPSGNITSQSVSVKMYLADQPTGNLQQQLCHACGGKPAARELPALPLHQLHHFTFRDFPVTDLRRIKYGRSICC